MKSDEERKCIIESYISEHYSKENSVDGLCSELSLCCRQTDRTVKRLFGESYHSLVRKHRMSVAKMLLSKTDMSMREIAEKTGYKSYTGFFLAVRDFYGETPEDVKALASSNSDINFIASGYF